MTWFLVSGAVLAATYTYLWFILRSSSDADDAAERWAKEVYTKEDFKKSEWY